MGIINVTSALIGSFLVDRAGRRFLLLSSIIGITISTAALGAFYFVVNKDPTATEYLGWLPLTSLSIFLISFSLGNNYKITQFYKDNFQLSIFKGYGPVMWLMIGEVYSKDINAIISPITGSFNWLLAFIITLVFRPISEGIGIRICFNKIIPDSFIQLKVSVSLSGFSQRQVPLEFYGLSS